jgi:hypothetical protein
MKFMLLIGGNRSAWSRLSEADWSASKKVHADLIAELKRSGEFIECDELDATSAGARVVRSEDGVATPVEGPLHEGGDFASGYYLLECRDIDRASEVAGQLYESRFAAIEVRQVGS